MILTEQQVKDWASIDQDMRRRMQLFVDFAKLAESTHDTHYFVNSYEFFEPGVFVLDARSSQDPDGSQRQRKIKISAHRLLGEDDSIKESAELWYENVIGTEKIAFKRLVAATSIPHKLVNRHTGVIIMSRDEQITGVAIFPCGASEPISLEKPARHQNVVDFMLEQGYLVPTINQSEQGFITNQGRWLTRFAARKFAVEISQVEDSKCSHPELLTSLDLW